MSLALAALAAHRLSQWCRQGRLQERHRGVCHGRGGTTTPARSDQLNDQVIPRRVADINGNRNRADDNVMGNVYGADHVLGLAVVGQRGVGRFSKGHRRAKLRYRGHLAERGRRRQRTHLPSQMHHPNRRLHVNGRSRKALLEGFVELLAALFSPIGAVNAQVEPIPRRQHPPTGHPRAAPAPRRESAPPWRLIAPCRGSNPTPPL